MALCAATSASGRASSCTFDIKKLGRFWTVGKRIHGDRLTRSPRAGWRYLHLAIDDHSRLAYAELLPRESPADCVAFLRRARRPVRRAWHRRRTRPLDDGNGYRSRAWAAACAEARARTPPHASETAVDQRQSRDARQDAAS